MNNVAVITIGLVVGSFVNIMIDRIPRQESIVAPRSHCPACGQILSARDLIPVFNYLWLGGRCHYCQQPIKIRCPFVEALTATLFWLIFLKSGASVATFSGWIFFSLLLAAACTDIEEGIIPDRITYSGIVLGYALAVPTIGLYPALQGSLIYAAFFGGIAYLSDGGLGGGDIKLAGVIGAFLGTLGAVMSMAIASLLGGLWAVILLRTGRATRKSVIKFGPFMAAAAMLVWLYGPDLWAWYLSLYNPILVWHQ